VATLLVWGVALALVALFGVRSTLMTWDGPLLGLERALIYLPSRERAYSASTVGGPVEEVTFGSHASLYGWFVPGRPDRTLLIFCGNGGNLTYRAPLLARMRRELGVSLFIFDYQGYGRSSGVPSEAATSADARAALAYLRGRPDVDPRGIAYYGESLGSAVAVDLAADEPPAALVLNAPFTSISDMARVHYWVLGPLLGLVRSRYDSATRIGETRVPVLVVHGENDAVVPVEQGRRLYDAANEPKRLLVVPGAGHNDLVSLGGAAYWAAVRDVLGL
jgi:hypothetical protein